MAKESSMLALGTKAVPFTLIDAVTGKPVSLSDFANKKLCLIMFICNHCPYVKHINHELVHLANDYLNKSVAFIAINSNDINTHPEDAPEKMKETAAEIQYPFPYLFDETQAIAKAYQAVCTPDFYIYDENRVLVYRGQLDDSRPKNTIEVTGSSIRSALNALLLNQSIDVEQKPSIGCGIKWKEGA